MPCGLCNAFDSKVVGLACAGGVDDLSRLHAEVLRNRARDVYKRQVDALFVHALAHKFQLDADIVEGQLAELAHGVLLASSDHEVLGGLVLQNQPHALDIILGIAPVEQAGQIAEIERCV